MISEESDDNTDIVTVKRVLQEKVKQLEGVIEQLKRKLDESVNEVGEYKLLHKSAEERIHTERLEHQKSLSKYKEYIDTLKQRINTQRGEPEGESEKPSRYKVNLDSKSIEPQSSIDNSNDHILSLENEIEKLRLEVKKWFTIAKENKKQEKNEINLKDEIDKLNKQLSQANQQRQDEISILHDQMDRRLQDLKSQLEIYQEKVKTFENVSVMKDGCTQADLWNEDNSTTVQSETSSHDHQQIKENDFLFKNSTTEIDRWDSNLVDSFDQMEETEKLVNSNDSVSDDFDDRSSMMSIQTRQLDDMVRKMQKDISICRDFVSETPFYQQNTDQNEKISLLNKELANLRQKIRERRTNTLKITRINDDTICKLSSDQISVQKNITHDSQNQTEDDSDIEQSIKWNLEKIILLLTRYELDETLADIFGQLCIELDNQGFDGRAYFQSLDNDDQAITRDALIRITAERDILKNLVEQQNQIISHNKNQLNDLVDKEILKNEEKYQTQIGQLVEQLNTLKNTNSSLEEKFSLLLAEKNSNETLANLEINHLADLQQKFDQLSKILEQEKLEKETIVNHYNNLELQWKTQSETQQTAFTSMNASIEQLYSENQNLSSLLEIERSKIAQYSNTESNTVSELERLRNHLIEMEDSYTKQALSFEERETELLERTHKAESCLHEMKTMQNVHLKELSDLKTEKDQAVHDFDQLKSELNSLRNERAKLQTLFDQEKSISRDKIDEQVSSLKYQLQKMEVTKKDWENEKSQLVDQFETRLKEELKSRLEKYESDYHKISAQVRQRDQLIIELREKANIVESKTSSQIEKLLMRNLLIGYFKLPINKRPDALKMMTHLLDFSHDEFVQIEQASSASPGIYGWIKSNAPKVLKPPPVQADVTLPSDKKMKA